MSELTREEKRQIAALAAKGWKAEGIAETKKEPAPAATDTSSEIKHLSTTNDTIDLAVCQDALEYAERDMISIYNSMTEAEQHAWDLGEVFANLMRARGQFV